MNNNDMVFMDYLGGSFEFDTSFTKDTEGNWVASAQGLSSTHPDQWQALNDLNIKLNTAMERGQLTPDQG